MEDVSEYRHGRCRVVLAHIHLHHGFQHLCGGGDTVLLLPACLSPIAERWFLNQLINKCMKLPPVTSLLQFPPPHTDAKPFSRSQL